MNWGRYDLAARFGATEAGFVTGMPGSLWYVGRLARQKERRAAAGNRQSSDGGVVPFPFGGAGFPVVLILVLVLSFRVAFGILCRLLGRSFMRNDINRVNPLGTGLFFEFDTLPSFQGLIPFHLDRREVDKQILTFALFDDETKSLGIVEPFNLALVDCLLLVSGLVGPGSA